MVKTRLLGKSGCEVSEVGYGAWAIGGLGYGDVPERDALAAVETYLELGGRNIDTARGYGVSEIYVGKVLKHHGLSDEVFVASKSGSKLGAIIRTDLETSLFCLQRDYVDLYYVHVPPKEPDVLDRMLDVYQGLKDEGKMRLVGVSQAGDVGDESVEACRRYIADERVDVIQFTFSLVRQRHREVLREAMEKGTGIVARMNLEGGFLTGKYRPGHVWPDKENDWRAHRGREHVDAILAAVQELARTVVEPPYASLAQVALAFPLATEGISAIIPGGKSAAHVRQNMAVAELPPMEAAYYRRLVEACGGMADLFSRR